MVEKNSSSKDDPDHHFAPPTPPGNTDYRHARWPRILDSSAPVLPPRSRPQEHTAPAAHSSSPRVVVVGVCSAGKSTLVANLKAAGYNARAVSQEHSYVPHLWQRSKPDVLIYLDASLPTIRRRRRPTWQQPMLDAEHERLRHAREHCHLYVVTDDITPEEVTARDLTHLHTRTPSGRDAQDHAQS